MPPRARTTRSKKAESPSRSASRSRSPAKKSSGSSPNEPRKRSVGRKRPATRQRNASPSPKPKPSTPKPPTPPARGRTPTRKVEDKVPNPARSRSASRSRRVDTESPKKLPSDRQTLLNVLATAVRPRTIKSARQFKSENGAISGNSKPQRNACRSWFSVFLMSFKLDFFGPLGSLALMISLPPFVFAVNALCTYKLPGASSKARCSPDELLFNVSGLLDSVKIAARDVDALFFLLGWLSIQAIFYLLPIGRVVDGYDSREKLRYRVNLVHALALTVALITFVVGYLHHDVLGFVLAHLFGLAWWCTVLAFVGALVLFLAGRKARTNALGNTGWAVHDYFMGRTRNPRVRGWKWLALFDIKMFFELRPGLLLWALVDVSYLAVHYQEVRAADPTTPWYGIPTGFSWNLALLVLFHVWYVVDAAFCEEKILSTFDIVTEGFGWMLFFGDMPFVPFVYSVSARYLLASHGELSPTAQSPAYLIALTLMHCIGYFVFRASNNVKHEFRTTPNAPSLAHLRTMSVAGGKKILVSGWWGLSRHPNFIGDILMSWSWSLLCGCPKNMGGFFLAYFYPLFITILLVSRALRDDIVRREKYGEASWKRYCEAVKWRIIPYIF